MNERLNLIGTNKALLVEQEYEIYLQGAKMLLLDDIDIDKLREAFWEGSAINMQLLVDAIKSGDHKKAFDAAVNCYLDYWINESELLNDAQCTISELMEAA